MLQVFEAVRAFSIFSTYYNNITATHILLPHTYYCHTHITATNIADQDSISFEN